MWSILYKNFENEINSFYYAILLLFIKNYQGDSMYDDLKVCLFLE